MQTEDLEDLIGNQQMAAYRYGTHIQKRIESTLKVIDDRITNELRDIFEGMTTRDIELFLQGSYKTKRLVRLKESLRELRNEATAATASVIGEEGKEYAGYEAERFHKLAIALGAQDVGASLSATRIHAAVKATPMTGKHIRDHIKDLSETHIKLIKAEIVAGYSTSESTDSIMRRIRGTAKLNKVDGALFKRNGAIERLIVRSALSHISSVASELSMQEWGLDEYYLSPVFDGITSKICAALNSPKVKYYKVGSGVRPPFHPGGCRTMMMPRVRDSANIEKPFVNDKRKVQDIPKDERSDKIGTTNAKTYEAHFKRQSVAWQKEWLGGTKYKLWKGGLPLGKFADPLKGKTYNLTELRALNADVFEKVGL